MFSKENFRKTVEEQLKDTDQNRMDEILDDMIGICEEYLSQSGQSGFRKNKQRKKASPMMEMMEMMMGGRQDGLQSMRRRCRGMMEEMKSSSRVDSYSTDELTDLFTDWCSHVEEEIVSYIRESGEVDGKKIAEKFHLSEKSVSHLINNIKVTGKI